MLANHIGFKQLHRSATFDMAVRPSTSNKATGNQSVFAAVTLHDHIVSFNGRTPAFAVIIR